MAVLIKGEPGVGKSALVSRFLHGLRDEEATVMRSSGLAFGSGPYTSMSGIFEPLLERKTLVQEGRQVTQVLLNLARFIPSVGSYAEVASSIAEGAGSPSRHDLQTISGPLYVKTLLVSLFEKLSKKRPLVVFLDDLQWFDDSSLEMVGFLIVNLSRIRALVLMTCRSGYATNDRERQNLGALEGMTERAERNAVQIDLGALGRGPSEELVRMTLGSPKIDRESLLSLVERSNGNPLLIKKTLRELVDQKLITATEGGWRLTGDPHNVVPSSFSSLAKRLLLRIQGENKTGRTILDYAAILGKQFSVDTIAGLADLDVLDTKHVLEELESVYGLVRATDSPTEYYFDHDLTREVILSSLGGLANPYHLKVARMFDRSGQTKLEPHLTAYHFEEAGEFSKAFSLYRLAAKRMESSLAYASEASYLEKCLAISTKLTLSKKQLAILLADAVQALFFSGKFNEAFAYALKSLEVKELPRRRRAEMHLLAGKCCRYLGTPEAGSIGMKHLNLAVSLFNGLSDQGKVGEAYSSLATLADHFGHPEASTKAFGRSRKAFNLARDASGLAILQRKSGMIFDSRRAVGYIENAIQTFKKTDSAVELARCYNNLGGEHLYIGELDQARESLLQAIELYRRFDFYEVDAPLNNLGLVQLQLGEFSHARESLLEAEVRVSEDFNKVCVESNLATLERKTGSNEGALLRMARLVPLVEKSGEPMIQDYFAFNFSAVLSEAGRPEEALDWLERYAPNRWKNDESLVLAKRQKAKSRILTKLGRDQEAREALGLANEGFSTNRPQKSYYELDYYPCDIHILD